MKGDVADLEALLINNWVELAVDSREMILKFYRLFREENEEQNLSRLSSPEDFFYGHVRDIQELLKSGLLEYPAMDLGSGAGVPGLLTALVEPKVWILAESERRKAEFLIRVKKELGAETIQVFCGRGEECREQVSCVVSRAVGSVSRIFGWFKDCSTWNNLILFKGPKWEEEWREFKTGPWRNRLQLVSTHEYSVGPEMKKRLIAKLKLVPRGTIRAISDK